MSLFEEILTGFAGLLLAVLFFFLLRRLFRLSKSAQAVVEHKFLSTLPDRKGSSSVETGCFVTFRVRDKLRTFVVPLDVYEALCEGDRGELTFRCGRFLRFGKGNHPVIKISASRLH